MYGLVTYVKVSAGQLKSIEVSGARGVDIYDLAVFTDQWLLEKLSFNINSDGIVNFLDFTVFANNWQGDMNQLSQFASQWLQRSAYNADIALAPSGDGGPSPLQKRLRSCRSHCPRCGIKKTAR